MQFVNPQIFWALALLAIPVIIHLFHFRRFKKVYFTNVRHLREIKEETATRNKLRNLLVLLMRLLAFVFLIFAFAQPYMSNKNGGDQRKNYVSIFVDNSFSMQSMSEDVPLFDKARSRAEQVISAYGAEDEFQVFSHSLRGAQQRWLSAEDAITAINELAIVPKVSRISQVLQRVQDDDELDGNRKVYILSDFQKSITDVDGQLDTTVDHSLIPFQSVKENNISIDSVWFDNPVPIGNQNNTLMVRVTNHGDEDVDNVRLMLVQNGQTKPEGTIAIPSRSSILDSINVLLVNTGWQQIEIKIDDYPIQFDDSYYIHFNIKETVSVLAINEDKPNKYLEAVFKGLNTFRLTNTNLGNIQYDAFSENDLIVLTNIRTVSTGLAGALTNYVANGGNVLVFIPEGIQKETYNTLFRAFNANSITDVYNEEKAVYTINTSEFIFDNVFESKQANLKLPVTTLSYGFTRFSQRGGEVLLSFRDGTPLITKYPFDKGKLYVCGAPLETEFNDLVLNAEVFVPMLFKMALSSSSNDEIAFFIGKDNLTEVRNTVSGNEVIYKIKGPEEFIPGQTNLGNKTLIDFNNMVNTAGYYNLELNEQKVRGLAFNYNRIESDLDYYSPKELEAMFENVTIIEDSGIADLASVIKEKDSGLVLWKWCLIFALVFLAFETLILRFWKV